MVDNTLKESVQWRFDMEVVAKNYRNHLRSVGIESPDATMNRSQEEHDSHFKALFECVKFSREVSILDIGCGKGNLISFIKNYAPDTNISEYLGIDLVQDFLDCARRNFPKYRFELGDFLNSNFSSNTKYDCVVALGVLVMQTHSYEKFVERFVRKMCETSSKYVVFNVISEVDKTSDQYQRQGEVGFPSVLQNDTLEKILRSISEIRYEIRTKAIFSDSKDSFVTVWKIIP